ncbi:MAG: CDP-diacylglycerol--glycerol-3-phosphate 3-phosphatidyltransferase [Elusimicrobia bacterium ADurb.Bin231]|nr:MAG: CDP-diacylglycerol--glycerol-3-phosphate 3-phosphatidyltransferase [Elusimicrobia bacterium ADurb.Bin231]
MNLANKITLTRIMLVPVFITFMCLDGFFMRIAALFVFIIASISDSLDGYVARKYGTVTDFGKFIDPLADKLLVSSALIIFVEIKEMSIPSWLVIIIISREFIITGLRSLAATKNIIIPAAMSGKFKTFSQVTTIITILVILSINSFLSEFMPNATSLAHYFRSFVKVIPFSLMFITAILTLVSGLSYIFKHKYLFFEKSI